MTTVFPFSHLLLQVITRPSESLSLQPEFKLGHRLTMKGVTCLLLCLIHVRLSPSCLEEKPLLICLSLPQAFSPGFSSLVMALKDVGVLNSTVLQSDALSSVSRLRFEGAGITGISAGAFSSLQNLTALSLIRNQLTDISPSWFSRPGVLSELSLTGNRIRVLNESTFEGLANLRRLSLNENLITGIHPDTFSSLENLAELDLSDNKMTQVSHQVFRSLRSTRISLDGNPWDCSCEAEAFVDFLKDLQSRSLLNKPLDVVCESPPPLRGRAVWNVSVCETPATSKPPSGTQTVRPKPTGTSSPSVSSETKTSNPPGPSDPVPSDPIPSDPVPSVSIPSIETDASVTRVTPPPPSASNTSDRPEPSDPPRTGPTRPAVSAVSEKCETSHPSSDTNIASTLIAVIVVLAILLLVTCFLVVHRRKRGNKTVMPEKDGREEGGETSRGSSRCLDQPENVRNDELDTEAGWRRSFTGVRAKSANAVLFTSPFCAPVTDQVTLQSEMTEKQGDEAELDEGTRAATESQTKKTEVDVVDNRNVDDRASPNTETVPYLSIGANQSENAADKSEKQSRDGQTERSVTEKVMSRISTWPLTAMQWQTRCKMTEEEGEKAPDIFTVTTPELLKEDFNKQKHLLDFSEVKTEDRSGNNPPDESRTRDPQSLNQHTAFVPEEQLKKEEKPGQTRNPKPAERSPKKSSRGSNKPRQRTEPKRAEREANSSSRAPSGGVTPDDETLLSGNEYAFMDLLHEVVQNNGRWTRERWRQTHVNKPRR